MARLAEDFKHSHGVSGVGGSNPLVPTKIPKKSSLLWLLFYCTTFRFLIHPATHRPPVTDRLAGKLLTAVGQALWMIKGFACQPLTEGSLALAEALFQLSFKKHVVYPDILLTMLWL